MDFEKKRQERSNQWTIEEQAEILKQRMRAGELSRERVYLAALLGGDIATQAIGVEKTSFTSTKEFFEAAFKIDASSQ